MTDRCDEPAAPPKKVSLNEAARSVQTKIDGADAARAAQLVGLQRVRQAKTASLIREQTRLSQTLGPQHARVTALSQQIAVNQNLAGQIARATARSQASVPQADANTWILHGHVRTRDLKPVPRLTVALYSRDGQWLREFGHDCTDGDGHFRLCVKLGEVIIKSADEAAAPVEAASAATINKGAVFIRVTDSTQALLHVERDPVAPRAGAVDYREIILGDAACAPPPGGDPRCGPAPDTSPDKSTRFLGNMDTHELHDLQNTKKNCRIDAIASDRRVFFATPEDAVKAGYDYCAYCFGKDKSKR